MVTSTEDRRKIYSDPSEFFAKQGRYWMKLTRPVAVAVVKQCQDHSLAVSMVEGGIWHNPGFEARLDAIWHSEFDHMPTESAIYGNNAKAAAYLKSSMPSECDAAIISVFETAAV